MLVCNSWSGLGLLCLCIFLVEVFCKFKNCSWIACVCFTFNKCWGLFNFIDKTQEQQLIASAMKISFTLNLRLFKKNKQKNSLKLQNEKKKAISFNSYFTRNWIIYTRCYSVSTTRNLPVHF